MAQTRRKRKHRGTPAGTIERRGRTSKPPQSSAKSKARSSGRAEARMTAAERREARFNTPPTWRGAVNRAAVAAAILVIFIGLVQQEWATAAVMGVFALLIYIPMSYYTDMALYRRRMRKRQGSGG
jgi:Flp pilus assembly protein TadB